MIYFTSKLGITSTILFSLNFNFLLSTLKAERSYDSNNKNLNHSIESKLKKYTESKLFPGLSFQIQTQ